MLCVYLVIESFPNTILLLLLAQQKDTTILASFLNCTFSHPRDCRVMHWGFVYLIILNFTLISEAVILTGPSIDASFLTSNIHHFGIHIDSLIIRELSSLGQIFLSRDIDDCYLLLY